MHLRKILLRDSKIGHSFAPMTYFRQGQTTYGKSKIQGLNDLLDLLMVPEQLERDSLTKKNSVQTWHTYPKVSSENNSGERNMPI